LAAYATPTQGFVFWQPGGGYDRNIHTREAATNTVNYIHANPLRKKLVEDLAQWYYSSYKDWHGLGTGPIKVDTDSF
jgi:putative transposase